MCDAIAKGDAAALESVLAEDMRLTHITGMVQSRDEFLAAMKDGTPRCHGISAASVECAYDSRTAEATLHSLADASMFGARDMPGDWNRA